MAAIDQFARPGGWKITSHESSAFTTGGILLIGIANKANSTCNVAWVDAEGQWWAIDELPLEANGNLAHDPIDVKCESTQKSYPMHVDLWFQDDSTTMLNGKLSERFGEGPVGIFTAEAQPGEPPAGM